MNAVEIEEAISQLAEQPFDAAQFPFAFLEAFGNKPTTIKKLRAGESNKSDIGGVLQKNNIHIAIAEEGNVTQKLIQLRESQATTRDKARFILATDGNSFEAEDLHSGDIVVCKFAEMPNHFGIFLPLASISTVQQIRDNPVDIRATSQLNKLYVTLLKDNPDWAHDSRRLDMNHFIARLIFCFFAENTDIFDGKRLFTTTIAQMSAQDSSNTHDVVGEMFRAMNTPTNERKAAGIARWADVFPYVNGGLFSDKLDVPQFSKIARSHLLHIGSLDWQKINPDIFGSMIQAIADDEERGELGMHYTSVPNILKVLNPLFLDDLRAKLDDAGDNGRKLLNLRNRISRIRVFDPACGSGNFLVIAYKEMRAIEAEINRRRGEVERKSAIALTNFRGIELRNFPAEIARLALIIAEYQCDVIYRGQKEALKSFLPLGKENWVICGNALRLDWLDICPPTDKAVKLRGDDLFSTPLDQTAIDFDNEGGETYICGNPPYRGAKWQNEEQKSDLSNAWKKFPHLAKITDYISGWIARYLDYIKAVPNVSAAFVATNSICQGQQASEIWPIVFNNNIEIRFAHTSFKWNNLARYNAGVTVVIIGLGQNSTNPKWLFYDRDLVRECNLIGPYLVPEQIDVVQKSNIPIGMQSIMLFGNMPRDGGNLLLTMQELAMLGLTPEQKQRFIRPIYGAQEFINGQCRYVLWIEDDDLQQALTIPAIASRINAVRRNRLESKDKGANKMAARAHQMREMNIGRMHTIVVARVSSENRDYLPVGLMPSETIISDSNFALYDAPLWNMALIASRLHLVWIDTVCGKLKTDFRYSKTLGWNTFPVPTLTDTNKADLTRCAEDILLARESHFPATIADLYAPDKMPENLRRAHQRNDEVIERIYIGRLFKNDSERREKLFDLYSKMTAPKGVNRGQKVTKKHKKGKADGRD